MRTFALVLAWLAVGAAVGTAVGQPSEPARIAIHIEQQPLRTALSQFARQTGIQLLRREEDASIDGLMAPRIVGELSAQEALRLLLAGTGLMYEFVNDHTARIWSAPPPVPAKAAIGSSATSSVRLAQVNTATDATPATDPPAAAADRDKTVDRQSIEQVVVTAQRREQNLQEVPLAVTALSEATLKSMGAYQFADFAGSVPGLTMSDNGANHANFIIRGITSDITGGALQSTVGLYIDDLPSMDTYASLSTPDLHLFDVNRVEVLRGPQGTLFGSGAMGGAIRVITNKPDTHELEAAADVDLSTTQGGEDSYNVNAMLNLPLIQDKLAMRIVGYKQDTGGWVDNTILGKDLNSVKSYGGRVMFRFDPTERLRFTATFTMQNSEPRDNSYYTGVVAGQPVRSSPVAEFVVDRFSIGNLVGEYDFGGVKLRSSTSYAHKSIFQQQDSTAASQGILGPATLPSNYNWHDTSDNFFEEIHLYSSGEQRLSWFLGAFFRNQGHRYYDFHWIIPGSETQYGSGIAGAPGDDVYHFVDNSATKERATFGEVSWKFTDRLEATVGMRRFWNSYDDVNSVSGAFSGPLKVTDLGSRDSKSTYRFVVDYKLNPAMMIYAQAAEGYRVGGANAPAPDPTPPQFGPDNLWSYEVGAKTEWLDGRLRLNSALYYINWDKMQLTQYTVNGWLFVSNVGNTHSRGGELEVQADLGPHLRYTSAISYNDARIEVANTAIGAEAGDRVPGVAHFTMYNAVDWSTPLFVGTEGYVRLDERYVAGSYSVFDTATAVPMGNYSLLNFRIGAKRDLWDVALYADNLLNRDAVTTAIAPNRIFRSRPRTVGLAARVNF